MTSRSLPQTQLFTHGASHHHGAGRSWLPIALALLSLVLSRPLRAESFFPTRPDDPRAVVLSREAFGVQADGVADDTDAIQRALDQASGVLFVPEGRYRLSKTLHVGSGLRLIGYGAKRPVFVLGPNTPGFQEGAGRYMVHFTSGRGGRGGGGQVADAYEGTFYSGMSNIDFEIADGNPAAIGIRFHVAQHGVLAHMDFKVGTAMAALEDIGNQASDIHIHGGQYGIITKRTSPVWQFLLMDSSFDGQRAAAIHTQEAGFTVIRVSFKDMPVALEIAPGQVEQLYGRDLQLENIRVAAIASGNVQNVHEEITLTNIACSNVPHFSTGDQAVSAPGNNYVVSRFALGLEIGPDGREHGITLNHQEHALAQPSQAVPSDIPALPPMGQWVNVHTLGVAGDGQSDDTAALQAAIDQHPVLYLPLGNYRVSGPLNLKPDTVLIGLNPGSTVINLAGASAAFADPGDPVGVLNTPKNGRNIVSALGIGTGTGNPRAAGVLWLAGPTSMMDDVSFPVGNGGGGGPRGAGGPPRGAAAPGAVPAAAVAPGSAGAAPGVAAATPGAAVAPGRAGGAARGGRGPNASDTQAADILIKDGGGGIFRGNWAHDTNAKVGLRVENTSTPGQIYQLSNEHHMRVEVQFHQVRNWAVYDLQTEEENPAGALAISTEIQDSQDLLFANTYMYRVSRNVFPKTDAVVVRNSDRISFENVKVFSQTRLAFDNAVQDEAGGAAVRPQFFTSYTVNKGASAPVASKVPAALFAPEAKVEQLATGFSNATGLTADGAGQVFFTDAVNHLIYHWNETSRKAEKWAEIPGGQPMVLGFVPPSSLLAVSYEKYIYSLSTTAAGEAQPVDETAAPVPQTKLMLPVGLHNELTVMHDMLEHRGYTYIATSNTATSSVIPDEHRGYFYAPGTLTAIMAGGTGRPILQSSQMAAFAPGETHYLTSEDDGRTYLATVDSNWKLTTKVFAERGGTSVVSDAAGNVYLASGQILIFDKSGKQIGVLEVPERPGSLAFGGPDKRTLYIGARSSLYAIHTQAAGQ